MNKRIHDVVQSSADLKKITEAIGSAIDHGQLSRDLQELGLAANIYETDWTTHGTIRITGSFGDRDDDTGITITLRLVHIEAGWDNMNVGFGQDGDA